VPDSFCIFLNIDRSAGDTARATPPASIPAGGVFFCYLVIGAGSVGTTPGTRTAGTPGNIPSGLLQLL
jgi:hypothetical protein